MSTGQVPSFNPTITKSTKTALKILLQIVTVSALLFDGWGLHDIDHFFSAPARAGLYLLLLVRNAAETLCLKSDPFVTGRRIGGWEYWTPPLSRLFMAFLCWFLPFTDHRGIATFADSEGVRYAGLVMFACGGSLQLVAMYTLGRQYSVYVTLQSGHRLVQNGVYRLIRHPIYTGLILNILGVTLVFRSQLLMPLLVLLTAFVGSRIRREEKLLSQKFGVEFDSYRRHTKLLLPHLY